MPPTHLLIMPFLATSISTAAVQDFSADRDALRRDVAEITAPGAPGSIAVVGPNAFAVIAGKEGKNNQSTVVAAAKWGKGRLVAFGHNGYLAAVSDAGTARFLTNSVGWAAGGKPKPKVLVLGQPALLEHLTKSGLAAAGAPDGSWTDLLKDGDVLCIDAQALKTPQEVEQLGKWVLNGGGLVTAATGWGWASLNSGKQLSTDFPGNRLLASAGLVFGAGTPDRTAENGYTVGNEPLALLNASHALEVLLVHGAADGTAAELSQASATVADALRSLPPNDSILLPRISALQSGPEAKIQPAPDKPLRTSDGIARLLVTRSVQMLKEAAATQLKAHPAAAAFPGAVPAGAPVLQNQAITVKTAVRDWHSTGLYAAPGQKITVTLPSDAVGLGLSVRIGCHSDALWHHDEWKRVPEITRTEKLAAAETVTASPFGGLIYVVVPAKAAARDVKVTISGAVAAPRFNLGQTTLANWRSQIRNAPGPWAELETSKIILTLPSSAIRTLEDPEALLKFWDQALDAVADLATMDRQRERPERIVADVQISAGYMHSGYPIMTHLDVAPKAISIDQLKADGWGYWHELGHNHQAPDWTFNGTTEVTCNLFSLYVCETVCGLSPGQGHEAIVPAKSVERLKKHLATRAVFERWKSDPFLALTMYDQLRVAFGWDTYKKVFAEYRDLPKSERPKDDQAKLDQWMVRFSRAAGKNLGPFLEAWGVPTSDAARQEIAQLPAWMPEDWPKL